MAKSPKSTENRAILISIGVSRINAETKGRIINIYIPSNVKPLPILQRSRIAAITMKPTKEGINKIPKEISVFIKKLTNT